MKFFLFLKILVILKNYFYTPKIFFLSTITPADVRKTIMNLDESITEKNIDRIVSWIFGNEKQIDQEAFKAKIENTNLFNYPRK